MIYQVIQPSLHLQDFIKDYTILHFTFANNAASPIKPFPANTQHCLVFYLSGGVNAFDPAAKISKCFPRISINGSQISRFDFRLSPQFQMFSVCFHPGALSKFLQLPLTEFIDDRIDAEAILNPQIGQLYEQMINAPSHESLLQMTEQYLFKKIESLKHRLHPIDKVAKIIAETPASFNMEKMAKLACLSNSQFERKFMQQNGITPKFFARINRFYQAYQSKDKHPNADWLRIALHSGYYDYQHLVKDFKQFSGSSPRSLLAAQARSPERILGIG